MSSSKTPKTLKASRSVNKPGGSRFKRRITIGGKLACGFGLMIALTAAMAGIVTFELNRVNKVQARVLEVREPTSRLAAELLNNVNQSLAALRGYIILGDEKLKAQRQKDWEAIEARLTDITRLAQGADAKDDLKTLGELKSVLAELRSAQDDVERVSHTDDNMPAVKILIDQAKPQVDVMIAALGKLIDEEQYQEGTEDRKALLTQMAVARGSLAVGFGLIGDYLISGDRAEADEFDHRWAIHQEAVDSLDSDSWMFTDTQTEAFEKYNEAKAKFAALPKKMFDIRASDKWNVANFLEATETVPRVDRVMQLLGKMSSKQRDLADRDTVTLKERSARLSTIVIGAAVIGILLGVFTALLLSRYIVTSITMLVRRAQEIASGDLTGTELPVRSRDELGNLTASMNEMSKNLQELIVQVTNASQEVAGASTQIAASSEEMATGISEQTSQVTQISSAVEEMSTSVVEVARKSAEAATSAEASGKVAAEGGEVVAQTVTGMKAIADAVQAGAVSVSTLGKRGEQIGQIIEVINDIADQTNLLALNAAIEAARAGEHGRGFAVVADEVRKLADRTTKATEEIGVSIQAIQTETSGAVSKMTAGTQHVEVGVQKATRAGESLEQIVTGAQEVTGMIQSIAAAAEQQSEASEQVSKNIQSVSAVTSQVNEATNQTAQAASQLSVKAEQLRELVGRFKVSVADRREQDVGPPADKEDRRLPV